MNAGAVGRNASLSMRDQPDGDTSRMPRQPLANRVSSSLRRHGYGGVLSVALELEYVRATPDAHASGTQHP